LRAINDSAPLAVDVDSSLLQQALINLVINARDALEQNGTIIVRTQSVIDGKQCYAELSVEDDGPGIDPTTQTHLFEPFFTTKKDGKGSGLGLAMVHGTVMQHGGSVRVDSELGRGSRFTIRIPAANDIPMPATVTITQPQHQKRKILVVEDQPEVAHLLANLLQRVGYEVLSAERPSRALQLAQEQAHIDIVLCDLNMPEMHGTALAEKLKSDRPELPIVFMSGYSGDTTQLPVNSKLLGKPFSVAELQTALDAALAAPDKR
jgi:two-component system, cell cycle sensor histidine kinase and response regulator CckA